VIPLRRAQGLTARGARSQGGNEYLATWPLGLLGMNPRREEITSEVEVVPTPHPPRPRNHCETAATSSSTTATPAYTGSWG
jgi:hypothetical protein